MINPNPIFDLTSDLTYRKNVKPISLFVFQEPTIGLQLPPIMGDEAIVYYTELKSQTVRYTTDDGREFEINYT